MNRNPREGHHACRRRVWGALVRGAALLALAVSPAAAGTWVASGLSDRIVTSLAVDPQDPQRVYAATLTQAENNSLFKSTDGGAHWTPANQGLSDGSRVPSLRVVIVDPNHPQTLYVGTGAGVFKSVDAAASWVPANQGLDTEGFSSVAALAIDPTSSQVLYAGVLNGPHALYKSTDGGAHWSPASIGLSLVIGVTSIAIDPSDSQTLYAGTEIVGVFKSDNGGGSWAPVDDGLPDPEHSFSDYTALAISPTDPETVYVTATSDGVFKTENGGDSWAEANDGLDLAGGRGFLALAIPPGSDSTVYTGYDSGVYVTHNSGAAWSTTGTITGVYSLAIPPSDASSIYAGTNHGVFVMQVPTGNDDSGCNAAAGSSFSILPLIGALVLASMRKLRPSRR